MFGCPTLCWSARFEVRVFIFIAATGIRSILRKYESRKTPQSKNREMITS